MAHRTPLPAGTRLGVYEIVASLGETEGGDLYRATHTVLGRPVAIRVLPESILPYHEFRERLRREAGAISHLHHPNIAVFHDFGEVSEAGAYIVWEYLEGESLEGRLADGPLAPAEALRYGIQIAGALAAAHESGIVHRELSPRSVFLTKDGNLKLLEFGLAGALQSRNLPDPAETGFPTLGSILGRLGYMSPEQARGQAVGPASDIFSWGVLLYEMLSGRNPFRGHTSSETLSNLLNAEPRPLKALVPSLHEDLLRIIDRCLKSNPLERPSGRHLEEALRQLPSATASAATPPRAWLTALPGLISERPEGAPYTIFHSMTAIAVVIAVGLLVSESSNPFFAPEHVETAIAAISGAPAFQIASGDVSTNALVATVLPESDCSSPPCTVTFRARVLDATERQLTYTWSGCAVASGPIATCTTTGSEVVNAVLVVQDAVSGQTTTVQTAATGSIVNVFYATDRRPSSRGATVSYSGQRNDDAVDPLQFGVCTISIPPGHRIGGQERPLKVWRFQEKEDSGRHIVLLSGSERTEAAFFEELRDKIGRSDGKDAFVFVHGFRVDFEDAVRRTAQLAWDLGFRGAPILYSWPSGGTLAEYGADYESARWTRPQFARFLREVSQRSGASTIYIIAHSMGGWAVANALDALAAEPSAPRFEELILAAPDIDAGIFRQLASAMKRNARRITLYAADDVALRTSKELRAGYPRAGEAGNNLVVIQDVDTVDASDVADDDVDILDHSYFGNTYSVLNDISTLFKHGDPPGNRFGLVARRLGALDYWAFTPSAFPAWLFWGSVRVTVYILVILALATSFFVGRWVLRRLAHRPA